MKKIRNSWLAYIAWLYIAAIACWTIAYLIFGDRFGLLALFNMFAIYLFLPLPLIIAFAVLSRNKPMLTGCIALFFVFMGLWGELFIPKPRYARAYPAEDGYLSVMTYNLLGWQFNTEVQIETIRKENADVVLLQELNTKMADEIHDELAEIYPYQILNPQVDVSGMGVISRYPLDSTGLSLEGEDWVGLPQIVTLEWQSKPVTLVNIHLAPNLGVMPEVVERMSRIQQAQAQVIVDFAREKKAVIVGGDTNVAPLSNAYKIFTTDLSDSWREAGFGLGHSFPGSSIPGSSRPKILGTPVPKWLVRIDYIFHSNDWRAVSARMAQFDGVSDHRGIVVMLEWGE